MNASLPLFDHGGAMETIPLPDADVRLLRAFYRKLLTDRLLARLLAETDWRQERIVLWGKEHLQPRLSAWHGDAGSRYAYSGVLLAPQPWTDTLTQIKGDIEAATGHRFNSVLLNLYRNEQDSVGWHSDAERELGPEPVIASLSLGETRAFRMRHKKRKDLMPCVLDLVDGSLLVMAGKTQQHWQHAVLKERSPCACRINLTFRTILQA